MHALYSGCAGSCCADTPLSPHQVKVPCVTTVGVEELQRAAEELNSFQSFMAPSLDTPTTAASSQAPEMPVDSLDSASKRTTSEDDRGEGRAKWHRGQGKGTQRTQQKPKGGPAQPQEQKNWWEGRRDNREQRQRFEIGCQSARQVGSQAGRQLVGDSFVIFMKHHKPATTTTTDTQPDWTVTSQLLAVGSHWKSQKERDPQELVPATQNSFVQLLVDSDPLQDRRAFEQASNQADCHGHGHTGGRPLPLHAMESRGFTACQGGSGPSEHRRCPADHHAVATTDNPSQHDWEVPPVEAADSGDGERCDSLDARNPKQNTGSPSGLPAHRPTGSKRGDPPCSIHSPPEQAGTLSSGNSSGQNASGVLRPDQSALLQLILLNPNSFSYANASLFSVLWASSCSQVGLCSPRWAF